jgi:aldehyde:ferredoxin oxidoreductase
MPAPTGYVGRILRVDLSAGKTDDEPIDASLTRAFLGGSGLAAALIARRPVSEIDPLGPDNPLVWMTGPLVGTAMPSAGRLSVCALSPLTGIWGESNSGGFLGPELRFAGYDGIVVTGEASDPVWLAIVGGEARLRDAAPLVDLDSYETQRAIRAELGDGAARVACIGRAGENRVLFASVMNDHGRAAGRTGMGAVMGAKNLKAIAVRGRGSVPVADRAELAHVATAVRDHSREDIAAQAIRIAGTAGYMDMALMYGDVPFRHFRAGEWAGASELSGVRMTEEFLLRGRACYHCPIACGRETRAPAYALDRADGPEYETLGALGALLEIDDLEAVIAAGHRCNAHGLDTISTGATIALACELTERGILDANTAGGLEIRFGDPSILHRLIEMIATREGIGDLFADGSAAVAEHFGVPELAATVKRLEVPMHDPRAFSGMAVAYALSPRGACHMQGDMYSVDTGQVALEGLGVRPGDRFDSSDEKGRVAARQMAWRSLYNAMILCQFQNPPVGLIAGALTAVTGWDLSPDDLMTIGHRIAGLKRLINVRRGVTDDDDALPAAFQAPLDEGGTLGNVPDVKEMLTGAYAEFGWNPDTGRPTDDTIARLGLAPYV